MNINYEIIPEAKIECCRELCNQLMRYQKSMAQIRPELFDKMNFETRLIPSVKNALHNYIVIVKDGEKLVGYVYTNISSKETYSNDFATFFDLDSVRKDSVGCLSQFYIEKEYRKQGVGTVLFDMSMNWLQQFADVEDYFIYVSNGNTSALHFYRSKGFAISHEILDGFITVLRSNRERLKIG